MSSRAAEKATEKSALLIRHSPWATGSLLLLAFLFWLLNHPYQGIWHDARVYGLIAAHWIYPEALANDLFFRFGSQGSLSLFTPVYGELVRVLGLDVAARLVVLSGGALWVSALFALSRTMLANERGDTLAGRFAVLFGVMLSISYSPNASVFVLNENFATARSWAMPAGVIAVGLLAVGRTWWASGVALLSCLLHPLLGIWPLVLIVLTCLPMRQALALTLLPTLALIAVGMLNLDAPRWRLMSGEWLDYLRATSDILFKSPDNTRLPVYFTVLVGLLAGARAGSQRLRPLYARLLALTCGGLLLALVSAYWLPLEIVVQGQPWRVFWLAIPVAGFALLDVIQCASATFRVVPLLIGSVLALMALDDAFLQPIVWLICGASLVPRHYLVMLAERACSWRKTVWVVMIALWLVALPGFIVELDIAGARFITPWWPEALWLHGLVAGSMWPLPLLLAWLFGQKNMLLLAMKMMPIVIAGLLIWVFAYWDKRPEPLRLMEASYLNSRQSPHPFVKYIQSGDIVVWPERELTVWLTLHTANYWSKAQGIGVVFSQEKFTEWQRRGVLVEGASRRLTLCADPIVDWVVATRLIPGIAPLAVLPDAVLYACSPLRAVSPAPTF
ncbi:MAG: hypothetical protein V4500_04805 [Pseudomonadota bacterium]